MTKAESIKRGLNVKLYTHRVVGAWNSLPLSIREVTSVNSFKALVKTFFMDWFILLVFLLL